MNTIILRMLFGTLILMSSFYLVGCGNSDSFPRAQRPLVRAIEKGDLELVKDLAGKTDVNTLNKEGMSILKIAMYEAYVNRKKKSFPIRVNIISELIRAGADPKNYTGPGHSPYGLAASMVTKEEVWRLRAFLEGGMSPNITRGTNSPIISDVIIQLDDDIEALKLLVKHGADVNINAKSGRAPIFAALTMRKACAALYLVENGADTDVEMGDEFTVVWAVYGAERDLNDGTELDRYDYRGKTLEQREAYIEKQKKCLIKLKKILIERGHTWPPKEPEKIKENRERNERRKEEKRLHREKYYPKK